MATITIMDPVTRIEGHMKVEVTIDTVNGNTQVVDARCTGTLFRGFEMLLKGRNPLDATVLTQRICGVCPISHGQASVLALEDVSNWRPTSNGRVLRNLTLGSNYIQSHILHFYLLAALDFVKGADGSPWTDSPWGPAWDVDMRISGDASKPVFANVVKAIEARRWAHEMGAIFGGRMPASHTFLPGGVTTRPTEQRVSDFTGYLNKLRDFIDNIYIPDVEAVASAYSDYKGIGGGVGNLLSFGVFETDNNYQAKLLQPGYLESGSLHAGLDPDVGQKITESVAHSWYEDATNDLTPVNGDTKPLHPKADGYSWLKSPRYNGEPYEVGPLARMWVNGDYREGFSVMHRHLARAYETRKVADAMAGWLTDPDLLQLNTSAYDDTYEQFSGTGAGLTEAPRGALGHWIRISNGKIDNYQVITPTCWNASPKDSNGVPGPMETALIGTPIHDPDRPIEALRVIHSFDPCLSCAVHVIRPDDRKRVY